MAFGLKKSPISDTVSVTPDGTIVVDAEKLLNKPHIRKMMREIRSKTRTVPRRKIYSLVVNRA